MMFPKALQAASRFRRSTFELRGHTSPVRADPRENLSNDVTSIKHTSLFISRTNDLEFCQPGLTPDHWYSFRKPDKNLVVVNDLGPDEWRLSEEFHPSESFVWIESWSSTVAVKLYGLSEDNFWEFFHEKWDYGDQIRICDGMLYSTLLHHLESLKTNGIVDSMVMLDYDEEPQSRDKYGTPLKGKQILRAQGSKQTTESDNSGKKQCKVPDGEIIFDWHPGYMRKYNFKIYFLTLSASDYEQVGGYRTDQLDRLRPPKLNKMTSKFLAQRLNGARSYKRSKFATETIRLRNIKKPKSGPASSRPTSGTTPAASATPRASIHHSTQKSERQKPSPSPQVISITGPRARVSPVVDTVSNLSSNRDYDVLEQRQHNRIEPGLPHFIYNRTEETGGDYYEYLDPYIEIQRSQYQDLSVSAECLVNKEASLATLVDILHARQLARKLCSTGHTNPSLFKARKSAAAQGLDVNDYLCKPGYHSPKVNSHKSCIPSAVKTDLIENAAPHPSYPLPRIREWPKECVKDKQRPSSGNKSQGCPVPTLSECRDIGKSKGSLKKAITNKSPNRSAKVYISKRAKRRAQRAKQQEKQGRSKYADASSRQAALDNLNMGGQDATENSSQQAVDGGTERVFHESDNQLAHSTDDRLTEDKLENTSISKDENDESSKLKKKTTMSSAKRDRHISMDVHMSAGELFPGMRSNTSKSIRKTLLAEPIPIDKLLRWELRRLTKVSYNAKAKQQIYDMVPIINKQTNNFQRSSEYENITLEPRLEEEIINSQISDYAILRSHASDTQAIPTSREMIKVNKTKSALHVKTSQTRNVPKSKASPSKLLKPTASGSGRVQASKTSSVMMTKSKKIEPEKNTKTEAKRGNKIVRTHTAVAKMESTVSLLEHVEYALPPPRVLNRADEVVSKLLRLAPENQRNVKSTIEGMEGDLFKGRYEPTEFQERLVEAMRNYKITLETVISSRGYSIASITICKPKLNQRLSSQFSSQNGSSYDA